MFVLFYYWLVSSLQWTAMSLCPLIDDYVSFTEEGEAQRILALHHDDRQAKHILYVQEVFTHFIFKVAI